MDNFKIKVTYSKEKDECNDICHLAKFTITADNEYIAKELWEMCSRYIAIRAYEEELTIFDMKECKKENGKVISTEYMDIVNKENMKEIKELFNQWKNLMSITI